ncbi:YibE/F family protein [Corynebacterium vitaeruminis]|uniref:YibE/F family protein n=1 Tax=Corynebacterium vitaeruminis TaxID=38305 RepID=UPI0039C71969
MGRHSAPGKRRASDQPGPSYQGLQGTSGEPEVVATTSHGGAGGVADGGSIRLWRRALAALLIVGAIVTAVGVGLLWPSSEKPNVSPEFYTSFSLGQHQVDGHVVTMTPGACTATELGKTFDDAPRVVPGSDSTCTWVITQIDSGDNAGKRTLLINSGQVGEPELKVGEKIRLVEAADADGSLNYSFGDYQRTTPLLAWLILIAVAIILFAAWRGFRALIGLFVTMVVVAIFFLPAILHGASPLLIAVFGGALILYLVLFLVHGWNWKTASALGGTLIALCFSAVLAHFAIAQNQLRGLGDDNNLHIILYLPDVSVTGLMLCGFIIGALGVLNDVAISQASTVNELSELDPQASPWRLFLSAMDVGRDHISSMVYTLVLSYTGASLPLLLLLSLSNRPITQTLSSDIMSTELLRSGIGALALTLAVPITTMIAAFTVPNREAKSTQ